MGFVHFGLFKLIIWHTWYAFHWDKIERVMMELCSRLMIKWICESISARSGGADWLRRRSPRSRRRRRLRWRRLLHSHLHHSSPWRRQRGWRLRLGSARLTTQRSRRRIWAPTPRLRSRIRMARRTVGPRDQSGGSHSSSRELGAWNRCWRRRYEDLHREHSDQWSL